MNLEEKRKILLGNEWFELLKEQFEEPYMKKIALNIVERKKTKRIYPPEDQIFNVYKLCFPSNVKSVIIGQDPYYTPNTAHGISFSSLQKKTPESLKNIFKEIYNSFNIQEPFEEYFKTNNLIPWVQQGIFMLNAVLTVDEGFPDSHKDWGWQTFTTHTIKKLDENHKRIMFLLWGSKAQKLKSFIKNKNHIILESPHPSPLSAHRGFLGCGHFLELKKFYKEYYGLDLNLRT